jgi:Family of unknown function (DUF6064)
MAGTTLAAYAARPAMTKKLLSCEWNIVCMSEWWTYTLSDFLMFAPRTYYRQFELYNAEVWPAQIAAIALGLAILALWRRRDARVIAAILAGLWLWVAWAYLFSRYDEINWAAKYLAAGFVAQALLLVAVGILHRTFRPRPYADPFGAAGLALFLFALLIQPLIGPLAGRPWTQMEIFGLAPDPTVVATLGLLLAAERPHWGLLVIPFLWCAISGATLWTMGLPDASVLPVAAVAVLVLTGWKARSRPVSA